MVTIFIMSEILMKRILHCRKLSPIQYLTRHYLTLSSATEVPQLLTRKREYKKACQNIMSKKGNINKPKIKRKRRSAFCGI